jgi:cellulose synthase/poly-beta-1,6-N-acetylglucosamine synthase-like glycosyltransferase
VKSDIILIILTVICSLTYLRYLLQFKKGLIQRDENLNSTRETVSVIVAARNEEKNIHQLLTALVNQSYSQNLYEVIIADDRSVDGTADIVNHFATKWDNVKLIRIAETAVNISPKKNALDLAIKASKNDIILLTDADCIPGKYWIESMIATYSAETAMVAGFSSTRIMDWEKASCCQKFENMDFIIMFLAAAGAISSGKYFSCSGQNLSYRRNAFEQVEGFAKIKHYVSGDDVNLMQLMRRKGLKIKFAFNKHSFVKTKSAASWIKLLNQRTRWASNLKWQLKLNQEFFVYLAIVFCNTFLPLVLLFRIWYLGLGIILVRMLFEYEFLKLGCEIFKLKKNKLKFYPIWLIMQPIYILLVTILGILGFFKWKK